MSRDSAVLGRPLSISKSIRSPVPPIEARARIFKELVRILGRTPVRSLFLSPCWLSGHEFKASDELELKFFFLLSGGRFFLSIIGPYRPRVSTNGTTNSTSSKRIHVAILINLNKEERTRIWVVHNFCGKFKDFLSVYYKWTLWTGLITAWCSVWWHITKIFLLEGTAR